VYELYRPWRRYDLLVFMKAMDPGCQRLMRSHQRKGRKAVFDANVNFYEEYGDDHFEGMRISDTQKAEAEFMTRHADAVIADSPYLAEICRRYHPQVEWIPDNVDMRRVPPYRPTRSGHPLRLLWSGQAHKLFEFLAVEDVLRARRHHIELVLVTNSLQELRRCHPPVRERLEALLEEVPHRIIPFTGIPDLWRIYQEGGICMAPRFLNNAYNQGHTEWKITLAMACGRAAFCSPLSSYRAVAERSGGYGIRICESREDWEAALDAVLEGRFDWEREEAAAREVVAEHYDTRKIAEQHLNWILHLLPE
jgi:glycosyltransferase involved in cell wall biosynthesis